MSPSISFHFERPLLSSATDLIWVFADILLKPLRTPPGGGRLRHIVENTRLTLCQSQVRAKLGERKIHTLAQFLLSLSLSLDLLHH